MALTSWCGSLIPIFQRRGSLKSVIGAGHRMRLALGSGLGLQVSSLPQAASCISIPSPFLGSHEPWTRSPQALCLRTREKGPPCQLRPCSDKGRAHDMPVLRSTAHLTGDQLLFFDGEDASLGPSSSTSARSLKTGGRLRA